MGGPVQVDREDCDLLSVAVCAVPARIVAASSLAFSLGAELVVDWASDGATINHARAWETACEGVDDPNDWVGVVEDDALCGSPEKIATYLREIPDDIGVLSAYLGTGVPQGSQGRIRESLKVLGTTGMIVSRVGPLNHVAVFARRKHAVLFGPTMRAQPGIACDTILDIWCQRNRVLTGIPVPSWFEHADGETTVKHQCNVSMPRKAHRYDGGSWSQGGAVALYPHTPGYSYWKDFPAR